MDIVILYFLFNKDTEIKAEVKKEIREERRENRDQKTPVNQNMADYLEDE